MPTIKRNNEIRENAENPENQDGVASALDAIRTAQQNGTRVMEIGPGGASMTLGMGSDGNFHQNWEGDVRDVGSPVSNPESYSQPTQMANSTEDVLSSLDGKKEKCVGQTFYVMGDKVVIGDDKYEKLLDKAVQSKRFGNGKIIGYVVKKKGMPEEFANIEVEFTREDDSVFSVKYDLNSGMGLEGVVAGIIDLTIPDNIIPDEPNIIL